MGKVDFISLICPFSVLCFVNFGFGLWIWSSSFTHYGFFFFSFSHDSLIPSSITGMTFPGDNNTNDNTVIFNHHLPIQQQLKHRQHVYLDSMGCSTTHSKEQQQQASKQAEF